MSRSANVQWPHRPETLALAELSYNAKFYGMEEVQQARGTEPVADAVRTIKLQKQQRKVSGHKSSPRVEVVISLSCLTIQDRKTKAVLYQFPMDGISYCANDHSEKKLFSFIARDGRTGKHICYVLGCEQNQADEILQTLGQAFDLNYRKHLETMEKQSEQQGQLAALQQKMAALEQEKSLLKSRVVELEADLERCTCRAAAGSGGARPAAAKPAASQPPTKATTSAAVAPDRSAIALADFAIAADVTGAAAALAQRNASVDLFGMESFHPPMDSTHDVARHQGTFRSNPWLGTAAAQDAFGFVGQPR